MRYIPTFEQYVFEKNQTKIKFDDLVGTKFPIELGSSTEKTTWDKDKLIKKISDVLSHNFFDRDFYYNWTNHGDEYWNEFKKNTLPPLIKNIDKTLNNYFLFKRTPSSSAEDVLVFYQDNNDDWVDNWFQTNKSISKELKQDYYTYRKKYSGVTLK